MVLQQTAMEIDILAVLLSDLYNLKNIFCETNENKHHVGKETNNFAFYFRITSQLYSRNRVCPDAYLFIFLTRRVWQDSQKLQSKSQVW